MPPNEPFGNGRDGRGRFTPGNRGGPGNPHAAQVARLRAAMLEAITPEDVAAAIRALADAARQGNVQAIRELLDRGIGKPTEPDFLERLEALEKGLAERGSR